MSQFNLFDGGSEHTTRVSNKNKAVVPFEEKIIDISLSKFYRAQALDYALEVDQNRALPHIKDGFKPVERSIFVAMHDLGCFSYSPYKKSARISGETMGKYHPHGDSAIYNCAVNNVVTWKNNMPLIDGQGNFGSIDGDGPAAMRYTEMRMSAYSTYGLFQDYDKNVVDFVNNYDNSEKQPVVLPISFPHLLVNGGSGIGVGVAFECLPHNFHEVMNLAIAYHDNPNITTDEMLAIMPAPDFPTGGVVYNLEGYRRALDTGRGSVSCRATYKLEPNTVNRRTNRFKNVLVIDSIPFQVNKEVMIQNMNELVRNDPMLSVMVDRIIDESEKDKIRIVVYLQYEGNDCHELVFNTFCNKLSKYFTPSFSYNLYVTGVNNQPFTLVSIRDLLRHFLQHRHDIVIRRTQYLINQAEKEIHKMRGVMAVLESEATIDETIAIIKKYKSKEANEALRVRFNIDEGQAQEILRMSLQRLTTDELEDLIAHHHKLIEKNKDLHDLLSRDERIHEEVRNGMIDFRNRFANDKKLQRRTIISHQNLSIKDKSKLIKEEDSIVILTESGYVKSMPNDKIAVQNRNGKGKSAINTNDDDNIKSLQMASSHDNILFFTSTGRVFGMKVWDLPNTDKGRHIRNLFESLTDNVVDMLAVSDQTFEEDNMQIIITTKMGKVRRSTISAYKAALGGRKQGIAGFKVSDDDEVISISICKENDHLILVSNKNTVNRLIIDKENLRIMNKNAAGMRGMKLKDDEVVIDAIVIPVSDDQLIYTTKMENILAPDPNGTIKHFNVTYSVSGQQAIQVLDTSLIDKGRYLMTISENGVGKKTSLSEFSIKKRNAAKGLLATKESQKSGKLIKAIIVSDGDEVIITTQQKTIKIAVDNVNDYGRYAVGVQLMDVKGNDKVVSMTAVPAITNNETDDTEDDNTVES